MLLHVKRSKMIWESTSNGRECILWYDLAEENQGFPSPLFVIFSQTENPLKLKSFSEILNSGILKRLQ